MCLRRPKPNTLHCFRGFFRGFGQGDVTFTCFGECPSSCCSHAYEDYPDEKESAKPYSQAY